MFAGLSPSLSPLFLPCGGRQLPPASHRARPCSHPELAHGSVQGAPHLLSVHLPLSTDPCSRGCQPGTAAGQGTQRGDLARALCSSREPFHRPHHSNPSAPDTLCPVQALWDDAIAIKVCFGHAQFLDPTAPAPGAPLNADSHYPERWGFQ